MDFYLIQYYCRAKYYHTMYRVADTALENSPNDAVLKLQYCTALVFENKFGEALRQLELLSYNPDVSLAVILAMIHAQDLCEVPDGEALVTLENRLKVERKRASEIALYYAANFYLQLENFSKAKEYEEMIFRLDRNSTKGYLIKGWLELNDGKLTKAADYFRSVVTQEPQNFDAAIGEILALSKEDALAKLNQLIVKYPKTTPPLIEKMKLILTARDWEQAVDIAGRILSLDITCIQSLEVLILYQVCLKGNYEIRQEMENLLEEIDRQEPQSWSLYYEFGTALSRVSGGNSIVVAESIKFLERAVKLAPENISLNLELAYQYFMLSNYKHAAIIYKNVAKLDNSASEALIGLSKCKIKTGDIEGVKEQLDFLLEIYKTELNPDLLMLQASLEGERVSENAIMEAVSAKFRSAENTLFGIKYFLKLDIYFILEALKKIKESEFKINRLRKLVDTFPGLIDGWIILAEIYVDIDDDKNAENVLRHVIQNLKDTSAKANLLLAQVLIKQIKFQEAESTLDSCLSQNLSIRSNPLFHFISGRIHKHRNNFEECIFSLENALKCVSESNMLKPLDMASLYLDLSSSYQITRQSEKASDAIQKATQLLQGTAQKDQIVMARAELELWKNDPNAASALLSQIGLESPMYFEARSKMADIELKFNQDNKKFIACFEELVKENPSQDNLIKLAEAYFTIKKTNEAINVYEKALKVRPSLELSKKLAEIYFKCHRYSDAMRCYREAGAEGTIEMARVLFAVQEWEMAELTLNHVSLQDKALLLAKIKERTGDIPTAINILNEAYKKIASTNNQIASQICCQMAEYESSLHAFESAIRHYKLALSHCEDNPQEYATIQIALSKLYLQVNDWVSCQNICVSLLSKDENNELALLMSADLSFRKCDFLAACSLFHKILTQKPKYWLALARMIEVKRRMALLEEVLPYLENASAVDKTDPGLAYCTGLYNWYDNNFGEALKFFSCVKHDPEWGQQALHNMVEIYLLLHDQETAEVLLQEIQPNSAEEETNRALLVNFVLLASRDKQLIDRAMNDLTLLASRDVLRVGASLGLAMGYTLQKQPQRSRNVLKIIAKTAWQFEEAEYLERCWLMLSEHYVQSGKNELAYELIKKILTYNGGCSKAHELLGVIAEKDSKYGDAATHYVKAWNLSSRCDPNLGFRLGMYFLKVKRYVDAISTCQAVFKKDVDNIKLRKEIYEKAIALLKT